MFDIREHLNDLELTRYEEWMVGREKPCGATGGQFSFTLSPNNIGMVIEVRDHVAKETIDLTDYDCW